MKELLSFEEDKLNWKIVLLLILIAYGFNIAVRYIYISYVGDIPQFQWQGHLMINNNDGYYWAKGAYDILHHSYTPNSLSPIHMPASIFTAFVAKFLPFIPFDVIIEYIPGFVGSLLVVPIVLIGRLIGSTWVGFIASLLGGMAWSYYHRTMFGYYDTDMLIVVLSTFAVWAVMWSISNKNIKYFLLAPLIEIIMIKWHGGLSNVANGIVIMSAIYVFVFDKKEKDLWIFLLFLLVPLLDLDMWIKMLILFVMYVGVLVYLDVLRKNIKYLLIFGALFYVGIIALPWLRSVLENGYFTKDTVSLAGGFKYLAVVNTVEEAQKISYAIMANRISGGWIGFVLSGIGFLLLLIRHPKMIISIPMVVLGLSAVKTGLRFTIFAVPFFALGSAYFSYLSAKCISMFVINKKMEKYSIYAISLLAMVGFIYPNYKEVQRYIMPTVFNKSEVEVLHKLKNIANPNDYVLSWWDYGYPIRYYADVKTFIDGGKHTGDVNFPVSFALTRGLEASHNMAILDTYWTEYNYDHNILSGDYFKEMLKQYHFKDPYKFEKYLNKPNMRLPKIKGEVYYCLPFKMLGIVPTVAEFSTIDLKTGEIPKHTWIVFTNFSIKNNIVILNKNLQINLAKGVLRVGKNIVPIKFWGITKYDKKGVLNKHISQIHTQGIDVVYMVDYHKILLMDDFYFNSAFVQLFVFENTGGLFEPVILNPLMKVYRVKK